MAISIAARGDSEPLMEMNTTPLIDVLLVLLIMFIMSLPMMTHAVKLDMQSGNGPAVPRETVNVEIDFDGTVLWNGVMVESYAQLEQFFRASSRKAEQPELRIMANARSRYDTLAHVLAMAKRNGMERIGIVNQ
jgi:biopolymer transport protein ExbD